METLEDYLPLVTARSLRSLCGAESEAAWAVVQSDLMKSHRSGAYVNVDGDQVRMMLKSGSPIWCGTYTFPSDQLISALEEIGTELSAGGNQVPSLATVVSGRTGLLGLNELKTVWAAIGRFMEPNQWTYGAVHAPEMGDRIRLSLLVDFTTVERRLLQSLSTPCNSTLLPEKR
ncbi:hypothetical protein [Acidovorax sp.]|uniref:hypothetical protein n=1 Tax=Acidovorax sp. TaxID=1872122 RepID=UPI0025BE1E02|nr:hypothetical protein [Acidovorax sp.]MBW8465747.1 hypothetical protein [Acidovorax sp.]